MTTRFILPLRAAVAATVLLPLLWLTAPAAAAPAPAGPPRTAHLAGSPYTATPTNIPADIIYTDPAITSTSGIWLGTVRQWANIRTGPGPTYAADRAWPAGRVVMVYRTVTALNGETWYQVGQYPNPDLYVWSALVTYQTALELPAIQHTGRWVDVNLTQQTLIAYEGAVPVLATQISSGKAGHETPVGSWKVYWRLPLQDMAGGGKAGENTYYNLADVPWIQYFNTDGDGLHGTYWHDNFGTPMSHGCVNLTYQDSQWLYNWGSLGLPVEVHY